MAWTGAELDARGLRVLLTGASSGVGLEVARGLSEAGAELILACRDVARGRAVARSLGTAERPIPRVLSLDPARLSSAHGLADALGSRPLSVLVHAQQAPDEATRVEGHEGQLAQRHLVPFALTGLLLPRLAASGAGRVVVVTGAPPAHRRYPFEAGLTLPPGVSADEATDRAALASLLATFELQRRFEAAQLPVRCVACTPEPIPERTAPRWTGRLGASVIARRARRAVLPVLVAVTGHDVIGGDWLGLGRRSAVVRREPPAAARDVILARRLVGHSERATGVHLIGP